MDSNQLDEAERVAVQFVKHSKAVPGVLITATPSAEAAKAAASGKSGEQTAAGQESETKKKTKKKGKHPRGPSVTTLAKRLLKEVRQAKVDAIRAKARQQQAAGAGAGGATSVQ